MTTMQEALADKYLSAAEVPDFLRETADLMQRSYANEKYGPQGLALVDGTNASDSDSPVFRGGIPSKRQNKIRSGRSGRKAANGRAALQRVGGVWDSRFPGLSVVKSIYTTDPNKTLCRTQNDHEQTGTKKRVAGTAASTSRTTQRTPNTNAHNTPNTTGSSLLSATAAKYKGVFGG